ncbi:sensor histidine kinase [Pedobacter caeni]|uniref:Histidine kinase n=1 Tax=Pedobacter caeni TaxID=288992 RepID=A0A1M5HMP5_9SPHI|nr:histidine kinase [Pedobacter caeni]SHG17205.1 Histidine kinase [Pedobacter caeni]
MTTKKEILIHVSCWILLFGYFYIGNLIRGDWQDKMWHFDITMNFLHIVEFYMCYLWVYPRFVKKRKVLQLIGGVILIMAVFISSRYLLEEVLNPYFFGFGNYSKSTTLGYYIRDNLYFGSPYILIAAAIWSTSNILKNEKVNHQLRVEAEKAELSFLKSQINPHFLYNTLNYIYSLALPVSDKMAQAVLRLSDLMRYTLSESVDGKVSLLKEVGYLESYVELFRMRFEPEFYVNFEVEGVNDQQRVAPLLLIPFLENAFKHGVLNDPQRPVKMEVKVLRNQLNVTLRNHINQSQKDHSSGVGLVNVQRRLQLIYPDKHNLEIENDGKSYQVSLRIEL